MLLEKVSLCRSCYHEYSGCTLGPRLCSRKISQACRNPLPSMYIGFLSLQNNGLTKIVYAEQAQVEKSRDAFVFNCAQRM